MNNIKKVSEKVLFIQSIDVDNMGPAENMHKDDKGFYLFDTS
jgi:hypothetical protein